MAKSVSQDHGRLWDVAVIGAGMGGGMTARALADAGYDVLLIDRGNEEISTTGLRAGSSDHDQRMAECQWPHATAFEIDGVVIHEHGNSGSGLGGSTNLYAAALERFERHDVDPLPGRPHPTGGWPVTFDELLPYYEKAERLLHVAGTSDPLNSDPADHLLPPPPLGNPDAEFMQSFSENGLHPYRLHVGIRYRPGCDECLGRLCQNDCRSDVRSVLAACPTRPTVMERTEVVRLEASSDRVSYALAVQNGRQIAIRARVFVLAAGALRTPKLLLQSKNAHWPEGLANGSGMVGRNLMFHVVQRFAIWPGRKGASSGPRKSLAFRDFYFVNGERLGSVQSTGFETKYGDVLVHLYRLFDRRLSALRPLRAFLRIPAALIIYLFGKGTMFAYHIEDLPYPENCIVLDKDEADGIRIKYTIKSELRERVDRLRNLLESHLDKRRTQFLSHDVELNYAHACGTCAMGDDPQTSVLNRDCQAHGIENLFIADSSFMPTSGAMNPGLTIAANSLRVADAIIRTLGNSKGAGVAIEEELFAMVGVNASSELRSAKRRRSDLVSLQVRVPMKTVAE